jgi:spermidine synthase
MGKKCWISEMLFDALGFRMTFEVERMLYEKQTKHQHLVLFKNKCFGKMMLLDGATQITMSDDFIYREMMSHVPLFAHGNVEQVLIVGGGDCSIAGEVLKHRTVRHLTQVEIDASVIEFCRKHFPELTRPVFSDKRFESIVDDGMKYIAKTNHRFDIIIVDSTDPQGPGKVLFSKKFYAACKHCLTKQGILVTQNGVPFLQPEELTISMKHFRELFRHSGCYIAAIPTYVGGHMAMGWASDLELPAVALKSIAKRYAEAGSFPTKYWTPKVHRAAFALPRFIEEIVEKVQS